MERQFIRVTRLPECMRICFLSFVWVSLPDLLHTRKGEKEGACIFHHVFGLMIIWLWKHRKTCWASFHEMDLQAFVSGFISIMKIISIDQTKYHCQLKLHSVKWYYFQIIYNLPLIHTHSHTDCSLPPCKALAWPSGVIWGSVSCPRTLWPVARRSWGSNHQPCDQWMYHFCRKCWLISQLL